MFIDDIKPLAKKVWDKYEIHPTVSMAQAILESGNGKSGLTQKYNNAFGIKAIGGKNQYWDGSTTVMSTKEDGKNGMYTTKAGFRSYPSLEMSYMDYGDMVGRRVPNYKNVRGQSDWEKAVDAMARSGYATDRRYKQKLLSVIKTHNLDQIGEALIHNDGMERAYTVEQATQTTNTAFLSVSPANITKEKVASVALGLLGLMGITAVITNIAD